MRYFFLFIGLVVLCVIIGLSLQTRAVELNTLNTIQYAPGENITISTRVLDGADVVPDVTCGVQVLDVSAGAVALNYTELSYDTDNEIYTYNWVPTPAPESFWDQIYHIFYPSSGMYGAAINCSGGSTLGDTMLNDTAVIVVGS